ncbi:hypothetical protein RRG08_009679 [Elysia crispata]|uniref:HAT C-terminal dimerisation domain-containing protein n=1 Tax=Elysia crispata TaxID=231223 RepID=A0AAE1AI88_9GAST|nr:hypothetical protein RRG08_009679 [Elysia crispata]
MVRRFLLYFIRPEALSAIATPKQLVSLDVKDKFKHLPAHLIFTGIENSNKNASFVSKCKIAFVSCAAEMLRKLPIDSRMLLSLSALDPVVISETAVFHHLTNFVEDLSHLLESMPAAKEEIRQYCNKEKSVPDYEEGLRVDVWWGKVCHLPNLTKLARAALTCFHGPQIESSFSIMGKAINKHSNCMHITTYSAIQTIKMFIKTTDKSPIQTFKRTDIQYDPINPTLCKNIRHSRQLYTAEQELKTAQQKQRKEHLQLQKEAVISKKCASKLLEQARKAAVKKHRSLVKKALPEPSQEEQHLTKKNIGKSIMCHFRLSKFNLLLWVTCSQSFCHFKMNVTWLRSVML